MATKLDNILLVMVDCLSPFVGMFIARISKGRTLREYILGTMLAPAMFCSIWIVIFSTLAQKIADNDGGKLMGVIDSNFSEAFFLFSKMLCRLVK